MSPTSSAPCSVPKAPDALALRLSGRRVLVTGAAAGIGLACARRFLAEGAQVALVDRDAARLAGARESLAPVERAFALPLDVSDGAAVREGVAEAARLMGGLDGIVNNAGTDMHRPFAEVGTADWNEVMAVNLIGAMEICRAALDPLAASGRGAIVNVASAAGLRPVPGRVAYCASKAALIMATKALALELAERGIRANAVCPGAVDTDLFRRSLGDALTVDDVKARYAQRRIGGVEEIAGAVAFLLSNEASFITGSALAVDGGRAFH